MFTLAPQPSRKRVLYATNQASFMTARVLLHAKCRRVRFATKKERLPSDFLSTENRPSIRAFHSPTSSPDFAYMPRQSHTNDHDYSNETGEFLNLLTSKDEPLALDLSTEVLRFYQDTRPNQETLGSRSLTVKRIKSAINKKFANGGGNYDIQNFGSTAYGLDDSKSDIDLVVMDSRFPNGFTEPSKMKKWPIYNVKSLASCLRDNGFKHVEPIPQALVPIVRFSDPKTGIHCDLNVNERLGVMNTRMLAQYCNMLPQLNPLIFLIKKWAKSHGFNSPSKRNAPTSFSSYALTLMTIGHLQIEGLLPNLQQGFNTESRPPPDGKFTYWVRTRERGGSGRMACDTRFNTGVEWQPSAAAELPSVASLFMSWLRYWGKDFNATEFGVSIREGGLLSRKNPESGNGGVEESDKENTATEFDSEIEKESDGPIEVDEGVVIPDGDVSSPFGDEELPLSQVDRVGSQQSRLNNAIARPRSYTAKPGPIVVMDPFILTKNVCSNVGHSVYKGFRKLCISSLEMVERGCMLSELLGQESDSRDRKKKTHHHNRRRK